MSEANPKARVNKNKEERRASHEGSVHGIRAPSLQGSVPGAWAIIQRLKALANHPHRQSEEGGRKRVDSESRAVRKHSVLCTVFELRLGNDSECEGPTEPSPPAG